LLQQAGIDSIESLGSFVTYVELAKLKVLGSTIEDVLKQPVRVVYTLLLYDKRKNKFDNKLNRLIDENSKRHS